MKRKGLKYLALAMLLPMVAVGGTARAEMDVLGGKAGADGSLDAVVQKKNVNGSDEKFGEYRDVEEGFAVNDFSLKLDSKTTPCYLDLKIRDALQEDESYRLTTGRHGKYKLRLEYDATPHNFSNGTFLWNGFGNGRLQIADVDQAALEAFEQTRAERGPLANVDTTGEDAVQQGIVGSLYEAADGVTFSIKRMRTGASLEFNLGEDAKGWLRVQNENRDGARVITAGTYERYPQGAAGIAHTEDQFVASGAETAEPIDYRTLTLAAGAGVYKKHYLADVEYTFTDFRNRIDALLWDNPFRITDASARNATDTAAANPFERGRFEVGQLVLPPDSQSHDVTVSGAVDLPMHGRLAGSLSYGLITQDEAFEPYTYNTAIDTDLVTAGVQSAATLARPQGDLDGEVQTLAGSLSLSVRPVDPVTVNAKYRYYDYNGKSDEILFPGYAGFGESFFRNVRNDVPGPDALVENEVFDYTRHNADLGVDYRVAKPLTLSLEGGWEGWEFDKLRLDSMDEYSVGAGFIFKPTRMAVLKASYKYSDRTIDGYLQGATAENAEARGLINYNWSDRERNQADARFQISPAEIVSFGIAAKWLDEEYDGDTDGTSSALDDSRFGRTDVESVTGALDVTVTPSERLAFYANYAREYRKEQMANAAKDDGFNDPATTIDDAFAGDNFNPLNYWNTDIYEKVDTVGIGATVQIIPEKLVLDAGYNLSLSTMDLQTFNPNGDPKLDNAVAQDWGKIRSRLHEVNVDLGYQFTENVKAGLRYLYEWYDLDDFAWNDMQPYMATQSVENTTKFVFTDATYDGYEAHVGGVYLICKF